MLCNNYEPAPVAVLGVTKTTEPTTARSTRHRYSPTTRSTTPHNEPGTLLSSDEESDEEVPLEDQPVDIEELSITFPAHSRVFACNYLDDDTETKALFREASWLYLPAVYREDFRGKDTQMMTVRSRVWCRLKRSPPGDYDAGSRERRTSSLPGAE